MAQRESGIAKWNAKTKYTDRHGEREKGKANGATRNVQANAKV